MISADKLAKMLSDVSLNKIITECVINVKDAVATVYAIDLTSTVFVQTNVPLKDMEDCQLGIGDLDLFVKYMNSLSTSNLTLSVKNNRLVVVPTEGASVRYVLSDQDLIVTFDENFVEQGDVIQAEFDEYDYFDGMALTQKAVDSLLTPVNLFAPNSIIFKVSKKGKVTAHSGKETEHQIDVAMGSTGKGDGCNVKVYTKHMTSVLNAINFEENPHIFFSADEESSIVIQTDSSSWILQPIEETE